MWDRLGGGDSLAATCAQVVVSLPPLKFTVFIGVLLISTDYLIKGDIPLCVLCALGCILYLLQNLAQRRLLEQLINKRKGRFDIGLHYDI